MLFNTKESCHATTNAPVGISQQPVGESAHRLRYRPFMEWNFSILVDAHTKWPEISMTKSTDSTAFINIRRDIFSWFGLPYTLVSGNRPQFKSADFELFLRANGIKHKTSAPYHPATNGQAERMVQTMKQSLRAMSNEPGELKLKLNRF
jgi:Integrase core domain